MIRSDKGVFWAILLPLIAVLIWSLNIAVTRYVAEYISPVSISFYRWLIAFLILTPWILPKVWQQRSLIRPHLKQLAVLSAFGLVLYQGLSYTAANYTTATNMGIMQALVPLIALLLSIFFLRHKAGMAALWGLRLRMWLAALGRLAMPSAPSPKACAASSPGTALNPKSPPLVA